MGVSVVSEQFVGGGYLLAFLMMNDDLIMFFHDKGIFYCFNRLEILKILN